MTEMRYVKKKKNRVSDDFSEFFARNGVDSWKSQREFFYFYFFFASLVHSKTHLLVLYRSD